MDKHDIRAAIVAAMKRRGMTRNQLAVTVAGKVSRSQVYDFIDGTTDLGADKATHLMRALGLEIHAKR